jgi:hypothetical protein
MLQLQHLEHRQQKQHPQARSHHLRLSMVQLIQHSAMLSPQQSLLLRLHFRQLQLQLNESLRAKLFKPQLQMR